MFVIPKNTDYVLKEGDKGLPVYALQRTATKLGISTREDGNFGATTVASAKALQKSLGVEADGIVGQKTQEALAKFLTGREETQSDLPHRLLLSKVMYESSGYLGAVNWSSAGGVDCCITQRRVYEHQSYDDAAKKRAFDPIYQLQLSGNRVPELVSIYLGRRVIRKLQTAYRVAILNHNYPALADQISRVGYKGLSVYYTSPQKWVTDVGLKFPDGHPIRTPLQWGQRYSLGNSDHSEPGQAVKLVDWSSL